MRIRRHRPGCLRPVPYYPHAPSHSGAASSPETLHPMIASPLGYSGMRQGGFTLVELIVVLVILVLAAAIVAPSLISSPSEATTELSRLVGSAREAAVRRGELVLLRADRSGTWQIIAGARPRDEVLMSGRLTDAPADRVELVFSPLGTCGPLAESEPAAGLDPLTCEVVSP